MGRASSRGAPLFRVVLLLVGGLVAAEVGVRIWAGVRGFDRERIGGLVGRAVEPESTAGGFELTRSALVRPSEHADVVYELKPGVRGTLGGRLVHTNSHGLRGREIEREKPTGTFRIVGLGDSHMFGSGVAQGQNYLDRLERRLNSTAPPGRRYQTLNFATPGFNTAQEVAMFERRALEFDPDLVVIHFVNDDLGPPRYLGDPDARERGGSPSYLLSLLTVLFSPAEEAEEPPPPLLVHVTEASERLVESLADRDYMAGQEGMERALERLALLTGERRIPVVLLMLGSGDAVRSSVRDLGERLGFHPLNALPYFREQLMADGDEPTREEWRAAYFLSGERPSELAHRAYAEALLAKIRELESSASPGS